MRCNLLAVGPVAGLLRLGGHCSVPPLFRSLDLTVWSDHPSHLLCSVCVPWLPLLRNLLACRGCEGIERRTCHCRQVIDF